jgi:hypothetical protein
MLQTKHLFNSTLGPPLRDAWVALGPRLGHPRATQSQTQSQSKSAEGRDPETQNATESPLRLLLFPNTTYQVPVNRYPTASLSLSHARTSSPAEDMSFATLCLTRYMFLVHGWDNCQWRASESCAFRRKNRCPRRVPIPERGASNAVKGGGHNVRSPNHGPNSARMNFLTPSRPVRRHQSLPFSRSIRMLTSKNGQQACSKGVNSASAW